MSQLTMPTEAAKAATAVGRRTGELKSVIRHSTSDAVSDGLFPTAGLDISLCTTEDKMTYLWHLYLQTEADLHTALQSIEKLREDHAAEVAQAETYVAHIRNLSAERETLTLEVEAENEQLHLLLKQSQSEVKSSSAALATLSDTNASVVSVIRQYCCNSCDQGKDITTQVSLLIRDLVAAQDELKAKKQEFETLCQSYSTDISELLAENEELQNVVGSLKASLLEAGSSADRQTSDVPRLREECYKLNGQLAQLTSELADIRASRSSLQIEINKLTLDRDNANKKADAAHDKMVSTCSKLESDLAAAKEEAAHIRKRLQDSQDGLSLVTTKLGKSLERNMQQTRATSTFTIQTSEVAACVGHGCAKQQGDFAHDQLHGVAQMESEGGRITMLERVAEQLEADNKKLAIKLQDALKNYERVEQLLLVEKQKSADLRVSSEEQAAQAASSAGVLLELKASLAQARLQHRLEADTIAQQMLDSEAQCRMHADCLAATRLDLKKYQAEEAKLQVSLLTETRLKQQAEERSSQLELETDKLWTRLRTQTELNGKLEAEKRVIVEECAQLKISVRHESAALIGGTLKTDNSKFLELAQSKMEAAERRISELQLSLEKVACSLAMAEDQAKDTVILREELQQRKDEQIRLRGQLHEEQLSRSLSAHTSEDSSRQLAASKAREARLQQQSYDLQHALLDSEGRLATKTEELSALHDKLQAGEAQRRSVAKQADLARLEVGALRAELEVSKEKLQSLNGRCQRSKDRHKAKLAQAREACTRIKQELQEKVSSGEAELKTTKLSLQQEADCREAIEVRYKESAKEVWQLQARIMELDEELQEKSRCLFLCQSRADHLLRDNARLHQLVAAKQTLSVHIVDARETASGAAVMQRQVPWANRLDASPLVSEQQLQTFPTPAGQHRLPTKQSTRDAFLCSADSQCSSTT